MSLFDSMLLAHLAGDWLLQTEWMAVNKARDWRAMLSHLVIYHAVMLVTLLCWLPAREPRLWLGLGALAVTHAILDREALLAALMRALRLVRERPPERLLTVVVDQTLHLLLIGLAAAWLAR